MNDDVSKDSPIDGLFVLCTYQCKSRWGEGAGSAGKGRGFDA